MMAKFWKTNSVLMRNYEMLNIGFCSHTKPGVGGSVLGR